MRKLTDKKTKTEVESDLEKNANSVWKGKQNIDNFIVICEDIPQSLECEIVMGFKDPNVESNKITSSNISGQHIYTDVFTAQTIMAKTKQELYDTYIAKDDTQIIE